MEQFIETLDKIIRFLWPWKKKLNSIQRQKLSIKKQFGAVADIYMAKMLD